MFGRNGSAYLGVQLHSSVSSLTYLFSKPIENRVHRSSVQIIKGKIMHLKCATVAHEKQY